MSILKRKFNTRILVVIGGLTGIILLITLFQLVMPISCLLTAPHSATTPILLTCNRSITILDTPNNFVVDKLTSTRYVITPVLNWADISTVRFTIRPNSLIAFSRETELPIPKQSPLVFFTDSTGETTRIHIVTRTSHGIEVSSVLTAQNISNISFDGDYSRSFVEKDSLSKNPKINIYDLLAEKQTTFLKPLLGKDYIAFAPSGFASRYGWIERGLSGVSETVFVNVSPLPLFVREIYKLSNSFDSLVYSGDRNGLLLIDQKKYQVAFLDLMSSSDTAMLSPKLSSNILVAGFIGPGQTIPFVRTDQGEWRYKNNQWNFVAGKNDLGYFFCDSGIGYFDVGSVVPSNCTRLKIIENAVVSERDGVTTKIYESAGILHWVNASIVDLTNSI